MDRVDVRNRVLQGDVLEKLKELPENSVHCICTSPPYYGLRSYLPDGSPDKSKEIGLEQTPQQYIERLVAVFREARRVLHPTGVCWVNLGDTFASDARLGGADGSIKVKDLIMVPFRFAIAAQEDGWYVRSSVIWSKKNSMPEPVTDRPVVTHEHIFMLTKSARYFYDHLAVRTDTEGGGHNLWTVWHMATKGSKEFHFATWPVEIPRTCIKAGTSEAGCCPVCGAPYKREVDRIGGPKGDHVKNIKVSETFEEHINSEGPSVIGRAAESDRAVRASGHSNRAGGGVFSTAYKTHGRPTYKTTGWVPTCECVHAGPVPCVVLDVFAGSGTTLMVAKEMRRDFLGIELNPEYAKIVEERVKGAMTLEAERGIFDAMMDDA
jgi:site-specific DNA-methyltransferase (adenine-specific)